jgi:hypothetical protein
MALSSYVAQPFEAIFSIIENYVLIGVDFSKKSDFIENRKPGDHRSLAVKT